MQYLLNINRSGKAVDPSGGSSVPGIIPPSPSTEFMDSSGEVLLMDCYGMAYNVEDLIAALKNPGPMTPVMYGLSVMKVSESADILNYDIELPMIIYAVSEPFMANGIKSVTLRFTHPHTRSLGGGAAQVFTQNAHCFDASVLHKKSALFVPPNVAKSYSGSAATWAANLPVTDVTAYQNGSITYSDGGSNQFAYPAFRTPIGSLMGDDMSVDRLNPQIEVTCENLLPNKSTGYARAELSFPVALSRNGADLYFVCYKSDPRADDPTIPPTLAYHFCKASDAYTPVRELSDHFLLTLGPDVY